TCWQIYLNSVEVCEIEQRPPHSDRCLENVSLFLLDRQELSVAVMNDADRRGKPERGGTPRNDERVARTAHATAHDHVNRDVEFRALREVLELLIQHLQTLLRDLVQQNVIDADLQMVEACTIQPCDAIPTQKIPVRNERRDHAALPDR